MGFVYPFNLREIGNGTTLWLNIQPYELFFYIFLPPLLLDAALKIDWYVFKKVRFTTYAVIDIHNFTHLCRRYIKRSIYCLALSQFTVYNLRLDRALCTAANTHTLILNLHSTVKTPELHKYI